MKARASIMPHVVTGMMLVLDIESGMIEATRARIGGRPPPATARLTSHRRNLTGIRGTRESEG